MFRKKKSPRYPHRMPMPMIRRRLPMRYHMKHQFGVHDFAFLQTMQALTGTPMSGGNLITILKNGIEFFPSMLSAIRAAKRTINLESTSTGMARSDANSPRRWWNGPEAEWKSKSSSMPSAPARCRNH
jgi:phosphatidylserine/phosphatidylglycerophosphate/cardiolipin synthase-like enzyme